VKQNSPVKIDVSIKQQELKLRRGRKIIRRYPISSSRFGLGTESGSNKTPLGKFRISDKIGRDAPVGTIFVGRVALPSDEPLPPTSDLVLSRILWLDGVEEQNANTRDRFIYIHGTKHEDKIGRPNSHGCIRMRNADVIELFELVDVDTPVTIRQ
jgi:lipoprotein-anchoring transpeptidase ErfK/SrfK